MTHESDYETLYEQSGLKYKDIDPFKLICQRAALSTAKNIERFQEFGLDVHEDPYSRGESAYTIDVSTSGQMRFSLSKVVEGIGSKNMISEQVRELGEKIRIADEARMVFGRSFYRGAGYDNAVTVYNDLSSTGATPLDYLMFVAAGSSDWFKDEKRAYDIAGGTAECCNDARASWGGGETQGLIGMVEPGMAVLAGSSSGLKFPNHVRYPSDRNLEPGLRIILIGCPGPQTNGYTFLRRDGLDMVARANNIPPERRLDAYGVDIGNGQTYGEAILARSVIFTPLVDRLLLDPKEPTPIEYISHISGHGWSKVMRGQQELSYVFDKIPTPPPVFSYIQEFSGMNDWEAYKTFGMGTVSALFVKEEHAPKVTQVARELGYDPLDAGATEEGPKRVVIRPIGVTYQEDTLQIR